MLDFGNFFTTCSKPLCRFNCFPWFWGLWDGRLRPLFAVFAPRRGIHCSEGLIGQIRTPPRRLLPDVLDRPRRLLPCGILFLLLFVLIYAFSFFGGPGARTKTTKAKTDSPLKNKKNLAETSTDKSENNPNFSDTSLQNLIAASSPLAAVHPSGSLQGKTKLVQRLCPGGLHPPPETGSTGAPRRVII